jgi:hypothetical protein
MFISPFVLLGLRKQPFTSGQRNTSSPLFGRDLMVSSHAEHGFPRTSHSPQALPSGETRFKRVGCFARTSPPSFILYESRRFCRGTSMSGGRSQRLLRLSGTAFFFNLFTTRHNAMVDMHRGQRTADPPIDEHEDAVQHKTDNQMPRFPTANFSMLWPVRRRKKSAICTASSARRRNRSGRENR